MTFCSDYASVYWRFGSCRAHANLNQKTSRSHGLQSRQSGPPGESDVTSAIDVVVRLVHRAGGQECVGPFVDAAPAL